MQARDVMTTQVITVGPETPIAAVAKLLIEHRISGVPVVGMADRVLGMVTEGDLCRRTDLGTEKDRSRWRELFTPNSELAQEYLRTHGLTAGDVMTEGVVSVGPDTPLRQIADRMEAYRVKRVPVVDNGKLVGILTRANLVQALVALAPAKPEPRNEDQRIRDQIPKSWLSMGTSLGACGMLITLL
jgi:CBS domain-containing protein